MNSIKSVGILGAGKLGIVLAQLATRAGYEVNVAGSGDPERIRLTVETLSPGAVALDGALLTAKSDIVILAMPLSKFRSLRPENFEGKLVIDTMNHWWEVDGERSDTVHPTTPTSVAVQEFLSGARVVKAFSHMGYHNLLDDSRPAGANDRRAIAVAGDDELDVGAVEGLVDDLGFDPLYIGKLADSVVLEAGGPVFGLSASKEELSTKIFGK